MEDDRGSVEAGERPVVPWRFVAGAFLHFVVPFYLVALVLDAAFLAPPSRDAAAALSRAAAVSPALIAGYAGVAVVASLVAAAIDRPLRARRRRRPNAGSEARASMVALATAFARARGAFGRDADAALDRLAARRWDHHDPRQRALARDLAETVDASAAAIASAAPERRATLAAMAGQAIAHLAAARDAIDADAARDADARARSVAGYVEARYGGADFAGGDD